jgi:hypothetical protein
VFHREFHQNRRLGERSGLSGKFIGEDYVQEQLGHASRTLTADTYGRWLPKKPIRGGVILLDDPVSKVGSRPTSKTLKTPEKTGEPSGIRTLDPLIKSEAQDLRTPLYDEASARDSEWW